jgi:protein-S-isoprenylcysteine O-methyltransferase Ste14
MDNELRVALAVILIADLAIPAYYRRRAASTPYMVAKCSVFSLTPEVVLTILLLALLCGYVAIPNFWSWSQAGLPVALRAVGIPLAAVALLWSTWAFRHLGRNLTASSAAGGDHYLVTTGPYRWVRHPLYSGWTIVLLAYTLITASWLVLSLSAAAVAAVVVRTPAEEAQLEARFGEAYRRYRTRTGRFVPHWRTPKAGPSER